jgi:NADPH-dependent glutamate synthase beta subunit-like oxidoreductase
MKPFKHHNARSLGEARRLLKAYEGKARVNAGGTDLLGAMRDKCIAEYPEAIINIKTVPGLDYIQKDKGGLKIGALTKLADIARSSEIRDTYPILSEAANSVASPHVRNMATIGGNLAQDVRCWYYRYPRQIGGPIVCLRKGGNLCNALLGDNRYHSIFGAAPLSQYPCSTHCPAGIDIPGYLSKMRQGDMAEAARLLIDYNPLAAITGRICPVFCEPGCNRRELDESVAIHCVERGVGDYMLEKAPDYFAPPDMESRKKVAIVGSGPAGLAAAFYLRRSGHAVTVYEKLPEAGGMLFYSIPPYRLPKDVVKKQIEALQGMGIKFELGVDVGKDVTLADLEQRFNAIFMAGGTWKSLQLGLPGEKAEGVHHALDYLRRINAGEKVALGQRVIVIGGGSVAIDAARTARRLGASEVRLVCLECLDPGSKDRMLALDSEIHEAEEEGVVIHPSLGVREIAVANGKATGIETVVCTSVREPDGTFNPQYDASCSALSLYADSIIVAIGQTSDQSLKDLLPAKPKNVYSGGDMVTGPSTVVQAIASARKAVAAIESSLSEDQPAAQAAKAEVEFVASNFETIPRITVSQLSPPERIKGIDVEDIPGHSVGEIETEAHRCFNCGCLAVAPSDTAVALVALDARVVTTKRTLAAEAFFAAGAAYSTVLEPDELIKEIRIPAPPAGAKQTYRKFTLREPVDFAIVSVASVLTLSNGVGKDARIVLGAVAPAPVRLRSVEDKLKGRAVNEKEAAEAATQGLASAMPLAKNSYKVEIAKALVKQAIVG